MKEMTSKFIIATAILAAPAAGTALEASAQTAAVQVQQAVQAAGQAAQTVQTVQTVQTAQTAPSGTVTQAGISSAADSRETLREFGGTDYFSPSFAKKTPL